MEDEKLLKKLYELKKCIEGPIDITNVFVDKWIEETQYSISLESAKTVGLGNANKAVARLIKRAEKKNKSLGKVLSSSTKNRYVITDGEFVILMRNDYKLPTTDKLKHVADKLLRYADNIRKLRTKSIQSPSRAELDTLIKIHKAQAKGRNEYPIYDFGDGLPKVRADILMDMKCIFDGTIVFIDEDQGEKSPILLKNDSVLGILFQEDRLVKS